MIIPQNSFKINSRVCVAKSPVVLLSDLIGFDLLSASGTVSSSWKYHSSNVRVTPHLPYFPAVLLCAPFQKAFFASSTSSPLLLNSTVSQSLSCYLLYLYLSYHICNDSQIYIPNPDLYPRLQDYIIQLLDSILVLTFLLG